MSTAIITAFLLSLLLAKINTSQCQGYSRGKRASVGKNLQSLIEPDQQGPSKPATDLDASKAITPLLGISNQTCSGTWFINGNTTCECGNRLQGKIICNSTSRQVNLLKCYCMSFSEHSNSTLVVGSCLYSCNHYNNDIMIYSPFYTLPSNVSEVSQEVCSHYNREGQLCGRCKDQLAPSVYSYNLSCTECNDCGSNWVKYTAISFLPLTGFCLVLIMFRISVTSGPLNVFILISQVGTAPPVMRAFAMRHMQHKIVSSLFVSIYGIWNLDFFRLLYEPFCLHPNMTTVQVLALDYIIAVYPLLLIVITYIFAELHDRKIRVIVWLWRPFHRLCAYFKQEWDVKTSLIDAFATLLLLSYMKVLSASFDILTPVKLSNIHGQTLGTLYVYYDAVTEYFGKEHLPYALLALAMLVVFNILPLLLLLLYPCQYFQRILNHYRLRCLALHTFMGVFYGCYKDGTEGTRDYRRFAALYLLVRVIIYMASIVMHYESALGVGATIALAALILIAIFEPYKFNAHNIIDILMLTLFGIIFILNMGMIISYSETVQYRHISNALSAISIFIPLLYFIGFLTYKLFGRTTHIGVFCQKIWNSTLCVNYCRNVRRASSVESLPDRMLHEEEYEPLLAQSRGRNEEQDCSSHERDN